MGLKFKIMKNLFFVLAFMLIGTSFATNTVENISTFEVDEVLERTNTVELENTIMVRCCTVEEGGISVKVCGGSDPCAAAEKILDILME